MHKNGQKTTNKTIALIVAAGDSSRLGGDIPKPYRILGGKMLLNYSIEAFFAHPEIDGICVVIAQKDLDYYELSNAEFPLLLPCVMGGKTRQKSVRNGLEFLAQYGPKTVLIHDAARPFLTHSLIDRLLEKSIEYQAVIPILPVKDTIKKLNDAKQITETVNRNTLFSAQTPQCFDFQTILKAHVQVQTTDFTDDSSILEAAGYNVQTVLGEERNFKITTPSDWNIAEIMSGAPVNNYEIRTGMGFDVHGFCPPKSKQHAIKICGVSISHPFDLEGHSDGDVGLHALVDGLLGAMAEGDIGEHFPPSDPKWKGADSSVFVRYTLDLLEKKQGVVNNVDITLICEEPKLSPHRDAMRETVAKLLKCNVNQVSVKATTTEKLGFTGRKEGIAAQALATLKLPRI